MCPFSPSKLPIKITSQASFQKSVKLISLSDLHEDHPSGRLRCSVDIFSGTPKANGPSHHGKSKWWAVHYHVERLFFCCSPLSEGLLCFLQNSDWIYYNKKKVFPVSLLVLPDTGLWLPEWIFVLQVHSMANWGLSDVCPPNICQTGSGVWFAWGSGWALLFTDLKALLPLIVLLRLSLFSHVPIP